MLVRFIVSNFLSFRDEVEFNMIAGNFKIHSDHIYEESQNHRILRASSIYGSNASGKSNFVSAFDYVADLIIDGTRDKNEVLNPPSFKLDSSYKTKPSSFEIEFIVGNDIYSYAISILNGIIEREWLVKLKTGKSDDIIFERFTDAKKKSRIKFGSNPKNPKDRLRREIYAEDLRFNQPFIYEGYNKNIDEIKPAYKWFYETLRIVYPSSSFGGLVRSIALDSTYKKKANDLLRVAGTGIDSLQAEIIDIDDFFGVEEQDTKEKILADLDHHTVAELKNPIRGAYEVFLNDSGEPIVAKLYTVHKTVTGEEVKFELNEESDGTRRLIDLIPAFINTIENGGVFVVDEIDRSMHPNLIRGLMDLYLDSNNSLSKGQFIFTTHESNLLDLGLFRQDEIWFMEKTEGASKMYSLSDFKPRYDKDIKKGYLQGMFGAIPFIANPEELSW